MFCRACDSEKGDDGFYAGVPSRCKECHKAAMKVRALTNPRVQEYDRERAKTPERKEKSARVSRDWRAKHPDAYRAQNKVNNSLRDGKLTKDPCCICGTTEHVHAHHKDYSKPLDVKWLCAKCHHRIHSVFPELGGHYEAAE